MKEIFKSNFSQFHAAQSTVKFELPSQNFDYFKISWKMLN